MTKTCPECSEPLVWNAQKCRCGWKASTSTNFRPTCHCEAQGCHESALVRLPDGGNYCQFHYGQWWASNYKTVSPSVTDNPVCAEIRKAYCGSWHTEKGKLQTFAEEVADRMAA